MVTGRFYGESGQPTEALLQAEASLAEGRRIKAQSEVERLRFPPCNSQWSAAEGGRVWCTTKRYGHGLIKYQHKAHEVVLTCHGLADFDEVQKDLQDWFLFSPVVEWKEPGWVSRGSSSLPAPPAFIASVLKTHLQQMETQTCRLMMAALNMLTHALPRSNSTENLPSRGFFHKTQGNRPFPLNEEKACQVW